MGDRIMEIKIGIGVDELIFGLTESQVEEILGLANKIYTTDGGCRRLQFFDRMLELSFEPDNDGLLGWIEVHNPDATLFGHKLLSQPRERVLEVIVSKLGQPSECEDYASFDTVFYEEHWLEFHFNFGRLTHINFGVLYGKDDETLWPNLISENLGSGNS
jgi:hypothetical protein